MSGTKDCERIRVVVAGSDEPAFLPLDTDIGSTFAIGAVDLVLEAKTLHLDETRSVVVEATGRARPLSDVVVGA